MATGTTSTSFVPAYAVKACADLKADVASYCMMPNNSSALAKAEDFLRGAINEINLKNWQWMLTYQDITLTAGTATYSLAAAFKAPRHGECVDTSGLAKSTVAWTDPKSWDYWNVDRTTSGTPCYYTAWNPLINGQIEFDVPPDTAFVALFPTFRLRYFQLIVPCGPASSLSAPAPVEEFIVWRAKEQMASHFDPAKVPYAKSRADMQWKLLGADDMRSQLTDWE